MIPLLAIPFLRPEALHIAGPLSIQPFGVLMATGFILGSLVCQKYARERGIDPKTYTDILFWLALGAIVFGHLGHVFYAPRQYWEHPLDILKVWSGLSSFGGYFGCTVLAIWFFRRRGIDPFRGGDVLMIGLAFGGIVVRLGCFSVHDHVGRVVEDTPSFVQHTVGLLAVEFPSLDEAEARGRKAIADDVEGASAVLSSARRRGRAFCCPEDSTTAVCPCDEKEAYAAVGAFAQHYPDGAIGTTRFDLGLLDSVLYAFVFACLWAVAHKPRREGLLLALTPMLYAPIRLYWDQLRNTDLGGQAQDVRYLGLTPAQYASVALFALGAWCFWMSRKRPVWPGPDDRPWVDPATRKR